MNTTTNLGLRMPELEEQYKLADWNYNTEKIDEFAGQVNTALSQKLSNADVYRGSKIDDDTDLDTLTTAGTYYCDDAASAATLTNCPVATSPFILRVFSAGAGERFTVLYDTSDAGTIYTRAYASSTWGSWYAYSGTAVV